MNTSFRLTPLAAALLASFSVPALAADAQDSSAAQQLPEVRVKDSAETEYKADRVSSPKFTEPLVDTPQTITVIKKEIIQERVATTLTEALRNTPGITLQQGENGNSTSGDAIFMRGFDTQNSIFLDNIRDLGTAVRDTFNVEQIEVIKGPSGADNGRGATSGYINLASKLPTAESFQNASVNYGTEERRRATADINQQLGASSAVRLNLMGQDGGVAGRDYITRQSWGVAPSIALGLGTGTRFYLFSQHVRQNNTPDGGVSTVGLPGYRFAGSTANPVQQTLDAAGVDVEAPSSKTYYGFEQDFEDIKANMLTAKVEHDLKPGTVIRNTARYGKIEQERVLTGINAVTVTNGTAGTNNQPPAEPFTVRDANDYTIARSIQATGRTNEILTNQTNLTTQLETGPVKHALGGGVEFIYEKQFTPTFVIDGANPGSVTAANLYNPDRTATRADYRKNGAFSDGQTVTTAVYLFDTMDLTDRVQVNGSVRWERYETETETVTASTAGTPPVTTLTGSRVEGADNLFSWKAGVLFKPTSASSVYLSHANSLKPPGDTNFSLVAATTATGTPNANINSPNLDPQKATNTELGTKWDLFGGKLATTAALFLSKNKNDLARASDDSNSVIQYGEKEVKGIELGAVGQITPAWNLSLGITKQDTEVKEGTFATAGSTQTGAPIRFSPELTGTLWTTYRVEPLKLTLGAGAQYVDSQVRGENNNPGGTNATTGQVGQTGIFKVDSYTVFDAMVAWDATKNVQLQFNAYNLADEDYLAAINNGGSRYIPGTPRSYLASLNVRF